MTALPPNNNKDATVLLRNVLGVPSNLKKTVTKCFKKIGMPTGSAVGL